MIFFLQEFNSGICRAEEYICALESRLSETAYRQFVSWRSKELTWSVALRPVETELHVIGIKLTWSVNSYDHRPMN